MCPHILCKIALYACKNIFSPFIFFHRQANTNFTTIQSSNNAIDSVAVQLNEKFSTIFAELSKIDDKNQKLKSSIAESNKSLIQDSEKSILSAVSSIDGKFTNTITANIENISIVLETILSKNEAQQITNTILQKFDEFILCENKQNVLKDEIKILSQVGKDKDKEIIDCKSKDLTNQKEICYLNKKINSLVKEKEDFINNNISIVNILKKEKTDLICSVDDYKVKYDNLTSEYEKNMKKMIEINDDISNKNREYVTENLMQLSVEVKTLKEELCNRDKCNESLHKDIIETKCCLKDQLFENGQLKEQLDNANISLQSIKAQIKEIEQNSVETARKLCDAENKIKVKESEVNKLLEDINLKETKISKYVDENAKLRISLEKENTNIKDNKERKKINDLFSNSRTSTTIEQEKALKQKLEITQMKTKLKKKGPKDKLEKPEKLSKEQRDQLLIAPSIINTKRARSRSGTSNSLKRKLISSSRDSTRTSEDSNDKQKLQNKSSDILDNLDIFNEFEIIERLPTIGKHGW